MKVAVTGGSGVVGRAVVRHLVGAGHEVKALARSDESASTLSDLGAVPVPGHVLDYPSLTQLAAGCRWFFHVAGINELCTRDPELMWRVNVEGTRLVADACREKGVPRLIYTSSAVTIGERSGEVGTEDTQHRGAYLSEYERSKTEGERLLLGSGGDLEIVAVNPTSVQGPGRSTGTGRLLLQAARGRLPFLVDAAFSLVDIEDCARGHLLAAEKGIPGQRYLLSGATLTMREAVSVLGRVTDREIEVRFVRPWVLRTMSVVIGAGARVVGSHAPICLEAARVMLHGHRYDGSRAREALGLDYTTVAETLRRTVEWFEKEGLLGEGR